MLTKEDLIQYPKLSFEENIKHFITRRRQILVHSCIYYRYNSSIISDSLYDRWCQELEWLQKQYPEIAKKCDWADAFKDYVSYTGFNLPIGHPDINRVAQRLLRIHREKGGGKI